MPTTLNEKITKAKEKIAKLEYQRKVEKRHEREAERKKNSRRYYIIGELVAKYFPEFQRFEPGTKAENAVEFKPLETFLSVLAADQELMVRLKEMVNHRLSLQNDI
jgi:bacillopeptidase F (M6 metalloprotease family)